MLKHLELAEEALNQATMAVEQHNSQKDKYRFLDGYESIKLFHSCRIFFSTNISMSSI